MGVNNFNQADFPSPVTADPPSVPNRTSWRERDKKKDTMPTHNQKLDTNDNGYYFESCPDCHGTGRTEISHDELIEKITLDIFDGEFRCCKEPKGKIRAAIDILKKWLDDGCVDCGFCNGGGGYE